MSLFQQYNNAITKRCLGAEDHPENSVAYWQNKLFVSTIVFVIPFSLVALLPSIIFCWANGLYTLVFLDLLSFSIILFIALYKNISIEMRKLLLMFCAYFVSSFLLVYVGVKGPGLLFLYGANIFGLLILPGKYTWWWCAINTFVCILFALILHYDLSPIPEVSIITPREWVIISSNLIFLSLLSSAMIPRLFDGLSKTLSKHAELQAELSQKSQVLEKSHTQLTRKNEDLEHFAYVASHDLKEPLRMVTSFLQLLEKNYSPQLDEKAKTYIHFATDGASRMTQLINDLLTYARAGESDSAGEMVRTEDVIAEAKALLAGELEKTNGQIVFDNLPVVQGSATPLKMLFQNLISNGLKYQTPGVAPVIVISSVDEPDHWRFEVKDNGIGIAPEYFDSVFKIFTRLHTREAYQGTGMGLAICKKIIESVDGKIWVESELGKGSSFIFTIPKNNANPVLV